MASGAKALWFEVVETESGLQLTPWIRPQMAENNLFGKRLELSVGATWQDVYNLLSQSFHMPENGWFMYKVRNLPERECQPMEGLVTVGRYCAMGEDKSFVWRLSDDVTAKVSLQHI